ncbi:MAG: LysE family transporter [Sphingobacteriales bacterium]|nr:LysE family transporter [Sphingobacteriales bacterium]
MLDAVLKGVFTGITVSFLIGPIFFALMELAIRKGWRSGLFYVWGVILSDVVLIYFLYKLMQRFDFTQYKFYIGLIGGCVLMVFGALTFFSKSDMQAVHIENIKTYIGAFLKGVTINLLNPFVVVWWIGVHTTIKAFDYTLPEQLGFYFSVLLMVFLFDLVKIRFAYYLKQRLQAHKLIWVKKIAGICLFVFGIAMIIRVL